MTMHRADKTNTRTPRRWRAGKPYKAETARLLRRRSKSALNKYNVDD